MMKNNTVNTINRNFPTFEAFISYHFDGLSPHTLYQTLVSDLEPIYSAYAQNCVYVVLYEVYTDSNVTEAHINTFNSIRKIVLSSNANDELTEDSILQIVMKEEYCLKYGYPVHNLNWLTNNALDWYVKHIISLDTFKRIVVL